MTGRIATGLGTAIAGASLRRAALHAGLACGTALAACCTVPVGTSSAWAGESAGAPAEPAAPAPPPVTAPAPAVSQPGTPALVLDTQDYEGLLGRSVRAANGEDLGRIIDVILDREGRPRAAIIDFGGFLGVGSRKIAVDWRVLKFSADGKPGRLTLTLNRNQVRVSPEYKAGEPIVVLGASSPGNPGTEAEPSQAAAPASATAPAGNGTPPQAAPDKPEGSPER